MFYFLKAADGLLALVRSRELGDVSKRQIAAVAAVAATAAVAAVAAITALYISEVQRHRRCRLHTYDAADVEVSENHRGVGSPTHQ